MTKLSVCISTVTPRRSLLSRLLSGLLDQDGDYEVIVHTGDNIPHGTKVERMFREAAGSHVVVVDDDDYLRGDYMEWVLPELNPGLDFLGYRIHCTFNGNFWMSVPHHGDLPSNRWRQLKRGPAPKMPTRVELARRVPFKNHYQGDIEWAEGVQPLLETVKYIDEELYFYDFWRAGSMKTSWNDGTEQPDIGPQRDLGLFDFDEERVRWL